VCLVYFVVKPSEAHSSEKSRNSKSH
jgi:hypothetical protein